MFFIKALRPVTSNQSFRENCEKPTTYGDKPTRWFLTHLPILCRKFIQGRDHKTSPNITQKENSLPKPPSYSFQPSPRPNQQSSYPFCLYSPITAAKSTINSTISGRNHLLALELQGLTLTTVQINKIPPCTDTYGLILGRDRKTSPYSMQKENSLSKPPWYLFQPSPRPNQRSSCCSFSLHSTVTAAKSTIKLLSIFPSFDRHRGQINDQVVVHFPFIRPSPRPNQRLRGCSYFFCIHFAHFSPTNQLQKESSLWKLYTLSPLNSPLEKTVKNPLPKGISPQGDCSHLSVLCRKIIFILGRDHKNSPYLCRKKIHYQSPIILLSTVTTTKSTIKLYILPLFTHHRGQINDQLYHFR